MSRATVPERIAAEAASGPSAGPGSACAGSVCAGSACAHCGQLVIGPAAPDALGDSYCCEGCRSIHGWLKSARMEGYYDLLGQSGKTAPKAFIGEEYQAFLDSLGEPGVVQGMGRWRNGRHALALACGEISCAGCGWLLERLLQGAEGVLTFDVDFLHGEAFLEYDAAETTLGRILAVPAAFGYRLRPRRERDAARYVPDRALLYRLAISGACFANAMAFSLAVYLGAFKGMPAAWVRGFGMLGILISLPAVGYAASPFFSGAWNALKGRRFNIDVTVSIGILLSFALSLSSLSGGDTNFSDSLTGLIFFLLLGRWVVRRFEAGLVLKGRWFDGLRPEKVRVSRQDGAEWADAKAVRDGDVLELLGGEYAPMDGTLESGEGWMDTSLLTGESRATRFREGDLVFAGYQNVRGRIRIRVRGDSGSSRISGLGRELDALVAGRRSVPDGAGRVAMWFTLAVIACGLAALGLHWREGGGKALAAAASVFIISCSCALALAAPISRGLGLKRAMAMGFHFRAQTSLDALRTVRCVLFDKTGTLTFMRRAVSEWKWMAGAEGAGFGRTDVLQAAKGLCRQSLHPVALSLFRALEPMADGDWKPAESREVAHCGMAGRFLRKGHAPGSGAAGGSPGAGGLELCLCRFGCWEDPDGGFSRLGHPLLRSGLPIGDAGGSPADSCLFVNGRLAALIRFTDEIRPEVASLAATLRRTGVEAVLLSGDNAAKVEAFARECGFRHCHSGLAPEDKGRLAAEYRGRFGPCLAVGDGFNDNLLFGASDLAMAVHGGAVDLSKGTDILFTGARIPDLTRLFALASRVRRSIAVSFFVSGCYNAAAIAAAMRGGVSPLLAAVLMPLSGISLCAVALAIITTPRPADQGRDDKGG
ncbi:MAG TPA: HAD-IC family P-type ATPase [Fibrobacteria bacterium]|nr:HAD-IC family P-type ATPase [Fibrobacteria bacterium]